MPGPPAAASRRPAASHARPGRGWTPSRVSVARRGCSSGCRGGHDASSVGRRSVYPADVVPLAPVLSVQPADPEDFDRIAELTVRVYVEGELTSPGYTAELADVAGRSTRADLLVVRDAAGRVVGSVALVLSGDFGEVTSSDDEAAFRMLVVDPAVQGRGIGELLVTACLDRACATSRPLRCGSSGTEGPSRSVARHREVGQRRRARLDGGERRGEGEHRYTTGPESGADIALGRRIALTG